MSLAFLRKLVSRARVDAKVFPPCAFIFEVRLRVGDRHECSTLFYSCVKEHIYFSFVGMRFLPSQVFYNSEKQNTEIPHPKPFFLLPYSDGIGGGALIFYLPKHQMLTIKHPGSVEIVFCSHSLSFFI